MAKYAALGPNTFTNIGDLLYTCGVYLKILLRSLQFQAACDLTRWTSSKEKPKVAIYQDRRVAILYSTIHIIPLGTALALITMNARTTVVNSITTIANTSLQFAAKLLEVLMQTSLAAVFLGLIRQQLLGTRSVPLGSLFAPLQIQNISYLWSLELWGSATSSCLHKWQRVMLLVSTCFIIILAALVGPSGAILMIPRSITTLDSKFLFILDNATTLFPRRVGLEDIQFDQTSFAQQIYEIDFSMFQSERTSYYFADNMFTGYWGYSHNLSYTYASMPTALITGALQTDMFGNGSQTVLAHSYQPLVRMRCEENFFMPSQDPETKFVSFGSQDSELNQLITFTDLLKSSRTLYRGDRISNVSIIGREAPPSANQHSALFVHATNSTHFSENEHSPVKFTVAACTVDAIWVKAYYNFTGAASGLSTVNMAAVFSNDQIWQNTSDRIITSSQFVENMTKTCLDITFFPVPAPGTFCLSIAYGLSYITRNNSIMQQSQADALSEYLKQTGLEKKYGRSNIVDWSSASWTNPSTLTQLELVATSDRMGYNSAQITVKLSLVVLGIYCAVVIVHVVYTIATGKVGSSWDTAGELFMLGLNSSQPEHLQYTSAGVATRSTFREPVHIRVNEKASLEVVFINGSRSRNRTHQRVIPSMEY